MRRDGAYVAMTSDRPHRSARSEAEAVRTISVGAGCIWSPELVDAFVRLHHDRRLTAPPPID